MLSAVHEQQVTCVLLVEYLSQNIEILTVDVDVTHRPLVCYIEPPSPLTYQIAHSIDFGLEKDLITSFTN